MNDSIVSDMNEYSGYNGYFECVSQRVRLPGRVPFLSGSRIKREVVTQDQIWSEYNENYEYSEVDIVKIVNILEIVNIVENCEYSEVDRMNDVVV